MSNGPIVVRIVEDPTTKEPVFGDEKQKQLELPQEFDVKISWRITDGLYQEGWRFPPSPVTWTTNKTQMKAEWVSPDRRIFSAEDKNTEDVIVKYDLDLEKNGTWRSVDPEIHNKPPFPTQDDG